MPFSFPTHNQLSHLEQDDNGPEYPIPGMPVDKGTCRLLGSTALIVQALMGLLVIASLVYKRQREKPMRPWRIWLFDVSKQILGQAFVHGLNLLISDTIANVAQGNPCDLYFLNILVDTTLGVGYIYLVLHGADALFTRRLSLKGFQSGEYGDPPSINYWTRQATVYVFAILSMKLLIVGLFAMWPGIFDVAQWLLGWTGGNNNVEVIFVMGIFPIFMNVLQFWLIDSIVKASASSLQKCVDVPGDVREPLFRAPESEDDDDDESIRIRRRIDIETPPTPEVLTNAPPHRGNTSEYKYSVSSTRALESSSINSFSYPPTHSISSPSHRAASLTPTSVSSSISSPSSFRSKKSKRRSPPPPILRPPLQYLDPASYTISMTPSPPVQKHLQRSHSTYSIPASPSELQAPQRHQAAYPQKVAHIKSSADVDSQGQWPVWEDGENWAEKVEEEDWTGRRIGVVKSGLDLWSTDGGAVQVS